jgi:hypothetical protein
MAVLSSVKAADFVFLQRATGLTKGNLSSHLTNDLVRSSAGRRGGLTGT